MQLQLASDLHLEMYKDRGVEWLENFEPAADILILAGDITSATGRGYLDLVFESTAKRWKYVIYTAGNHEFYFTSLAQGWRNIKDAAARYKNVCPLNNELLRIEGISFLGGTAWFPRTNYPENKRLMSDFYYIRYCEPDVYNSNRDFKGLTTFKPYDVVITHHLPVDDCVASAYIGNPLNDFFVSQMDVKSVNPKYWLFGHTHSSVNIKVGNTRCIANPKGYPKSQNIGWNSKFVIEV